MRNVIRIGLAAAVATASLGAFAGTASAQQMGTQPFQFKLRGGAGGAMGMSPAHRQLIIERKLGRSSDNPVLRDRSTGALVDVVEVGGGAAILRSQPSPFLVRGSYVNFLGSTGGFSVGGIGVGGGGTVINTWIGQMGHGEATPISYTPTSYPTPIDSWISQLES